MCRKKQCAVCGDKTQSNVILKWKRDSDGIVFHVCAKCAELGKVNSSSVKINDNFNTYTTVVTNTKLPKRK